MTNPANPEHGGNLPADLSNPARRALELAGITRLEQVANWTIQDLLNLHGLGPKTIRLLRRDMEAVGLNFANE